MGSYFTLLVKSSPEEVIARDHNDAKKTALARNPTATVVSVNAKFT